MLKVVCGMLIRLSLCTTHRYLICGEKVKAKFLWLRTDEDFKTKHSDFNILWTAGKAMWTDVNPIQKVIELPKSALTGFLIDFIVGESNFLKDV